MIRSTFEKNNPQRNKKKNRILLYVKEMYTLITWDVSFRCQTRLEQN